MSVTKRRARALLVLFLAGFSMRSACRLLSVRYTEGLQALRLHLQRRP